MPSWLVGAIVAVASLVLSFAAAAYVIRRLPVDYLLTGRRTGRERPRWQQLVIAGAQNVLGVVLILAGVVMSVPGVPGQGVLTIVVGILLLRFPGKDRLERRLFARPRVLRLLNRFRTAVGAPPLLGAPET